MSDDKSESRPRHPATRVLSWSGGSAPEATEPEAIESNYNPEAAAAALRALVPDRQEEEKDRNPGPAPKYKKDDFADFAAFYNGVVDDDEDYPYPDFPEATDGEPVEQVVVNGVADDEEDLPYPDFPDAEPAARKPVDAAERPPASARRISSRGRGPGHRQRRRRERSQSLQSDPAPTVVPNPHSRLIVEVIGALGVADMTTAVLLCQVTGCASRRHYMTLMNELVNVGVLRTIPSGTAKIGAVIGRSYLLMPGEQWSKAVETLGAEPKAALWNKQSAKPCAARLSLMHAVIERVVGGWKLVHGKEWVAGLNALDRHKRLQDRAHIVAKALRDGYMAFKHPLRVLGLLPPDGTRDPALLVGSGAIRSSQLDEVLETAGRVAPLEVVCVRRSKQHVEHVRQLVMRRLAGRGDSSVTVLPSVANRRWRNQRRALLERLASVAAGAEREATAHALLDMFRVLLQHEIQVASKVNPR